MDSTGRCMKYSLICINVATFLGGVTALGIGLWIWIERSFSTTLMNSNMYTSAVVVIIVMGVAGVVLSLLGCCGAIMEVKCMLLTYSIFVFIIFMVTLVGGVLPFVFQEQAGRTLEREMYAAIPMYGVRKEYTKSWDETHTLLRCCGVKGPEDWNTNLPESCCRELYPGKRLECRGASNPTATYMVGCYDQLIELVTKNASYIGAASVTVSVITFLAMILSCCLFCKIE